MSLNIDVRVFMEKGMYERLVDRAQELRVPLSAVVRDAVVQYFEEIPVVPEREAMPQPDDPIWQLPQISQSYGTLEAPYAIRPGTH